MFRPLPLIHGAEFLFELAVGHSNVFLKNPLLFGIWQLVKVSAGQFVDSGCLAHEVLPPK
jgi:hypothetical protein